MRRLVILLVVVLALAAWFIDTPSRAIILPPSAAATTNIPSAPETEALACDSDEQVFTAFTAWAERAADQPALPESELQIGLSLARARNAALDSIIATDPERVFELVVPQRLKNRLPAEITALLEQDFTGAGEYEVLAELPAAAAQPAIHRYMNFNGRRYTASVYGDWTAQVTHPALPFRGVALNGKIAIHASPLRVLTPDEIPDAALPVANPDTRCPVSGQASTAVIVEAAGRIHYLCSNGHIAALEGQLKAAAEAKSPAVAADGIPGGLPAAGTYCSTGQRRLLLVRVDFSDYAVDPEYVDYGYTPAFFNGIADYYARGSYGALTFRPLATDGSAITPILRMPRTYDYYSAANAYVLLRSHARTAAAAAGYTLAQYNFDVVCMPGGGGGHFTWSGLGYVGAAGAWLQTSEVGTACHELGHNMGLYHANAFLPTNPNIPLGPGANQEYGDRYDAMGYSGWLGHFNVYEKQRLGWLPASRVRTVTASGVHRVTAYDHSPTLLGDQLNALRIYKDSQRYYWFDFRTQFSGASANGLHVHWSPYAASNGGTQLLDMAPLTANNVGDAPLVVGRTFSDPARQLHVTALRRLADPPAIDVVVNMGAFPGNRPPVISALTVSANPVVRNHAVTLNVTAGDPDGDEVVYLWEYDDATVSANNSPTQQKHWSGSGSRLVRCTVSDMKGGAVTQTLTVTVLQPQAPPGNHAPYFASLPLASTVDPQQIVGPIQQPVTAYVGQPVYFTALAADADNDPLLYSWNFGDGTSRFPAERNPIRAYQTPGTYTVRCRAQDIYETQVSATVQVIVIEGTPPPSRPFGGFGPAPAPPEPPLGAPPENHPPEWLSPPGTPAPTAAGIPVTFTALATDADGDTLTYTWDFGDGSSGEDAAPAHSFTAAGVYTVRVTASDGRGGVIDAKVEVTITDPGAK